MPVYEGVDIPALEWCSIHQAVLWIQYRQVPVEPAFASILPDQVDAVHDEAWQEACGKLFVQASAGGVVLRGALGQRPLTVRYDSGKRVIESNGWTHVEVIPPERVKHAGVRQLRTCKQLSDPNVRPTWVYARVHIDFRSLLKKYPARDGTVFRIGGDPVHLDEVPAPFIPSFTLPLSLGEAVSLLAFGSEHPACDGLTDQAFARLSIVRRHLLRALEAGQIGARGKWGDRFAHNLHSNSPEQQQWEGHGHDWSVIPAGHWEAWGVDWTRSSLKTREGEYLEIRVDRDPIEARLLQARISETESSNPEAGLEGEQQVSQPNDGPRARRGRKLEYPQDQLLALAAAILEFKGDLLRSDEQLIGMLQETWASTHGGAEPSRALIQDRVMRPLKIARRAYERARDQISKAA